MKNNEIVEIKIEKVQNKKNKGYHYDCAIIVDGTPVYFHDYEAAKIAYFVLKKKRGI